jgi:ABC-type uncharacterized transport system permease subunit
MEYMVEALRDYFVRELIATYHGTSLDRTNDYLTWMRADLSVLSRCGHVMRIAYFAIPLVVWLLRNAIGGSEIILDRVYRITGSSFWV